MGVESGGTEALADPWGHQEQMPLPQESGEGILCKYVPRKFFTVAPKSTYKLKNTKNEIVFLFTVINLQDVSMISFLRGHNTRKYCHVGTYFLILQQPSGYNLGIN